MSKILTTEHEVQEVLRRRFPSNAWALLFGVSDKVGGGSARRADALAMSLWPSRGLQITGIEIKVSRKDWLRELKQPEKADAVAKYCDHWYIVAGSDTIVKPDELPPAWGLMVPGGSHLTTVRKADKLEPKPIDKRFLASILRRLCERVEGHVPPEDIPEMLREARVFGREVAEERHRIEVLNLERDLSAAMSELASLRSLMSSDLRNFSVTDLLGMQKLLRTIGHGSQPLGGTAHRGSRMASSIEMMATKIKTEFESIQQVAEMLDKIVNSEEKDA